MLNSRTVRMSDVQMQEAVVWDIEVSNPREVSCVCESLVR